MIQKIRMDMSIGSNIQKRRYQCKLKQDQVIAKMNLMGIPISKSSYAKIETNRMNIKVSELLALAEILDCEVGDFFKDLKYNFHLSFVVIFSLSVVQFALQFFYFNGQYEFFFSLRSIFGCGVNIYISIRKHFSAPEAIIFSKSIDMNQAFVIMLAVSNLKNHGGPVYAT